MDPPARAGPDGVDTHEVVAGRYRLDRSLGTSRMAEVFAATDLRLRRSVAVKRLPSSGRPDATAEARFAREARALARVNDPNVVTVFDIVVDRGRPFLVMELVDGTTLRDLLDREGGLELDRAVSIATGIASGLAAVHASRIVHRDLKPSNVFLTSSGAVKIGDLGIARVASDVTLTRTGEVFGSAPYVAPEQVTGDTVDARADLYALGCVLFEMTTGRAPFQGDDPATLAYHHVHTTPERADAVVPLVPEALAELIDRLLAKDPADRPESADAVRRRLEEMPSAARGGSGLGDAAPTQPLGPPAATDVLPVVPPLPPAPPTPPTGRPPHRSSPYPWVAGLALGIALLLILNAVAGGADPAVTARTPAGHPSPSPASPAPTPRSPSARPTDGGSVEAPAAALIGLVAELGSSGALGEHLAKDLQHGVERVQRALEEGDGEALLDALGHLQDKVEKGLDRREIAPEDARRLDEATRELASTVDADSDESD